MLRFTIIKIDEVEIISIILQCCIGICLLIMCMDQEFKSGVTKVNITVAQVSSKHLSVVETLKENNANSPPG